MATMTEDFTTALTLSKEAWRCVAGLALANCGGRFCSGDSELTTWENPENSRLNFHFNIGEGMDFCGL